MTEGATPRQDPCSRKRRIFAPANVDRSLRANETAQEQARQSAALATAAADGAEALDRLEEAARLRDEAAAYAATLDEGAAVVKRLTEIGDTRGAWVAHYAVTLEQGARAADEARERGIVGAEPDRLTPEEYLAHEQAAIAADDGQRTITETDVQRSWTSRQRCWCGQFNGLSDLVAG